jgi:hypothetical protein
MVDIKDHQEAPAGALKRPMYAVGDYFTARDLQTWQQYRRQRLRRHNRYLHNWGVVCGLWVVPVNDPGRPWAVQVCPGYAISCCGDEIEAPIPAVVDVRDYLWRRPIQDGRPTPIAYVGIKYTEEHARPVPANSLRCGCDETVFQPSRIRDSFQVDVLWALPEIASGERFDLCTQRPAPCPECPDDPYVYLACITLPASEGDPITALHIDNWSCQRQI